MRSAGCIVNDISDKEFDKKVSRTKNRPIASNQVSVKLGIFYTLILCLLAFLVLINFNNLTILLALGSMPLAFTYPLMKRFTYWPQLFLGITFNYGLVLGWTAIQGNRYSRREQLITSAISDTTIKPRKNIDNIVQLQAESMLRTIGKTVANDTLSLTNSGTLIIQNYATDYFYQDYVGDVRELS